MADTYGSCCPSGSSSSSAASHFSFPFSNFWREVLISFKFCRTLYHYKIQVQFDIGNHPPNFGRVMALFRLSFYLFPLNNFWGMHWFHSNFAELYITIRYRSSSILVIVRQILAELWPFFDFFLFFCFHSITFEGMHWFHSTFAELCITCKIQVNFDIGNHPPYFGWVMALYQLSVDVGFRSVIFAGMHWFYWKFVEGYIFCKIQVKFDISNHPQNFGYVRARFLLSFCWCVDIGF